MGKALSVISKPFRNYNIESRAHKIISKDKPVPAPKYKSDAINYEKILKENPDIVANSLKKHQILDKNLKDVFVVSHDPDVKQAENVDRPLPLDRHAVEDFEYGFKESKIVATGKVSLRNAMQFIGDHQSNPKIYTPSKISDDYLLSEEKVRSILKYFRVYELYVPMERNVKATFAGPSIPRTQVEIIKRPELGAGKVDTDKT